MIKRCRTIPAALWPDVEDYPLIATILTAKEARQVAAIKEAFDVSDTTIIHEALALFFTEHEVALPASLVEYLEKHERPIPAGAKLAPKTHRFH